MIKESAYIVKLRYKPSADTPGSVMFVIGEKSSREEWVKAVKSYDEDLDLRTAKFVDQLMDTVCNRPQVLYGVQEELEG